MSEINGVRFYGSRELNFELGKDGGRCLLTVHYALDGGMAGAWNLAGLGDCPQAGDDPPDRFPISLLDQIHEILSKPYGFWEEAYKSP